EVLAAPADIRARYQAERAIAMADERFGGVDVLINNAGIIQVGPLDHMKLSDYEDAMLTHFWGPLYMMMAAIPHMRRAGAGRIVNISSIGGKIAVPHLVPYSASKFALTGLSEGLQAELARDGFRVTTVCPGLMRTGSTYNARFKGRYRWEFAWFHLFDSRPGLSADADAAAAKILERVRKGDTELVITMRGGLAILLQALSRGGWAHAMALTNRLLPSPDRNSGTQS